MPISTMGVGIEQTTGTAQRYTAPNTVTQITAGGGVNPTNPAVGPVQNFALGATVPAGIWVNSGTVALAVTDIVNPATGAVITTAATIPVGVLFVSDGTATVGSAATLMPLVAS